MIEIIRRVSRWPATLVALLLFACFGAPPASLLAAPATASIAAPALADQCQPAAMQAIAATLSVKVTIGKLPAGEIPGPFFEGGTVFSPATATLPAYCQISGSFVTDPSSGRRANFIATLPLTWNQKYLQLGCAVHCGMFAVNNVAAPPVTIGIQGKPGDAIRKGYAAFATDEGHFGASQGDWAVEGPGKIDKGGVQDLLYRANKVLARMGKEFTIALYAKTTGQKRSIRYSYYCGCSGGGRDTLVAASYFPEEFDGFVAGSAYADPASYAFQSTGISLATIRSADARLTPALIKLLQTTATARCDASDGVVDGLIQNPAACDFTPAADLPRCADNHAADTCFTRAQIETVSTFVSAVTDQAGRVVQPGFSISNVQGDLMTPPNYPDRPDPWADSRQWGGPSGGLAVLGDSVLHIFTHENDPAFHTSSVIGFQPGDGGQMAGYHIIVPSAEVDRARETMRMGTGSIPEQAAKLLKLNRKLVMWVNMSDQLLTPYMSINYYKKLARMYGGYDKLRKNIRLFAMPGTAHCSGGSLTDGPGSFDALGMIENWVEKGHAPDAVPATMYVPAQYGVDFTKPGGRTMPLCAYPEMARYAGPGDVRDAKNWACHAGDTTMLKIGQSGRLAGVLK